MQKGTLLHDCRCASVSLQVPGLRQQLLYVGLSFEEAIEQKF